MLPLGRHATASSPAAALAPKAELAGRRWWLAPLVFFAAVSIPYVLFFPASTLGMPPLRLSGHDQDPLNNQPVRLPAAAPPAGDRRNDSEPVPTDSAWPGELEDEDIRLDRVLKAAAMADNTVILSTSNTAWSDSRLIKDLFLESFHVGNGTSHLLKHLIIVALDVKAYMGCKTIHSHCFALTSEGVDFSEEKRYMSEGYLKLVWRNLDILRKVLTKGYNLVYSDADILWFRNPFLHFYPDVDFQSACDLFMGDPTSLRNSPNAGFMYVKANNRTILLFEFWYASRLRFPGRGVQGVFRDIKFDPYINEIGITFRFWSMDYFGGLCHPSENLTNIITMHATCCVGLRTKVHDLQVLLEDWRRYASLPSKKREEHQYSWSLLQLRCG